MEKEIKNKKLFLHISNIIISVLCIIAILSFFILPLWELSLSVRITPELINVVANQGTSSNSSDSGYMSVRVSIDPGVINLDEDDRDDAIPNDIMDAIMSSLADANIEISFDVGFDASTFVSSIFTSSEKVIESTVDGLADQIIENLEDNIEETVQIVVKLVVKESIRSGLRDAIAEEAGFDDIMADTGVSKERVDALIDLVIDAVMADGATVTSVTDSIMSVYDEVVDILKTSKKYKDKMADVTDENKDEVRNEIKKALSEYADESGRLNLKEALVTKLLDGVTDALSNESSDENAGQSIILTAENLTTTGGSSSAYQQTIENFKAQLKSFITEQVGSVAATIISAVMAVAGVLILITVLLIAYAPIRSLTKIKANNPGFVLALPIVFCILPYLLLVAMPNIGISIGTMMAGSGMVSMGTSLSDVLAVLGAISIVIKSGTFIAFLIGIALFIFSFFYGHQRRLLKKMLTAAPAESADLPENADAPAQDVEVSANDSNDTSAE